MSNTSPKDGLWYWVYSRETEEWFPALADKEAAGGWANADTWEDFRGDVAEYQGPIPRPRGRPAVDEFRGASEENTRELVRFVRERAGGSIWVYPSYVGLPRTERDPNHAATVAMALMAVAMGLGSVTRQGGQGVLFVVKEEDE